MRRALAFLTPFGGARVPSAGALLCFPFIGALIGAVLWVTWWGAHRIWQALLAAAVVVIADLALTGMLHFDGLVDSADGLLSHATVERRLEILSDSTIGAFGLAVGVSVLVLRIGALATLRPSVFLLVGIWALSRALMAVTTLIVPYARREGGLASAFVGEPAARRNAFLAGVIGLAIGAGCLLRWHPARGAAALLAEIVAAALVVTLAHRRIGGYTGDVLGALGVIGESAALLVAAIKW